MIDKTLYWIYEYLTVYHCLRGSDTPILKSLSSSFSMVGNKNKHLDNTRQFQKTLRQAVNKAAEKNAN
jgi:hypothetical protein